MRTIPHWINGVSIASSELAWVTDPATDETIASVPIANSEIVDDAISAASEAFYRWSAIPSSRRSQVLSRFRDLLLQNRSDLSSLISREHGKPMDAATWEIMRAAEFVEITCGAMAFSVGESSLQSQLNVDSKVVQHPLGVCIGITSFDAPAMMGLQMAAMALLTGNTFVWKPSLHDPSVSVRLAELLKESGLPDGAFNIVHGDRTVASRLIDDTRTEAVTFIGSSEGAHAVYARAAREGKRVQAFGGAKNHLVVMPDADVEVVAEQVASSSFGFVGQQACMATSVVVVVGGATEGLLDELAIRAEGVRLGVGTDPGTDLGPVVSRQVQEKTQTMIKEALAAGARPVIDRSCEQVPGYEAGYFVGPTILAEVSVDSPVYQEELLGPVLMVLKVETLEEAIDLIENHRYGQSASIFTRDGAVVDEFERRASVGMIGVNVSIPTVPVGYPVHGWKDSAYGVAGMGNQAWSFYTRSKCVASRWGTFA